MEGPEGIEKILGLHLTPDMSGVLYTSPNSIPEDMNDHRCNHWSCVFGKIYSTLNEILRRVECTRTAIVLHLDLTHPDAQFIKTSELLGLNVVSTSNQVVGGMYL